VGSTTVVGAGAAVVAVLETRGPEMAASSGRRAGQEVGGSTTAMGLGATEAGAKTTTRAGTRAASTAITSAREGRFGGVATGAGPKTTPSSSFVISATVRLRSNSRLAFFMDGCVRVWRGTFLMRCPYPEHSHLSEYFFLN
jgi:hypothetical protein